MHINLITSNPGKLKEFKIILGKEIGVNHIDKEYRELRSDDSEEIAKEAAQRLSSEFKKPIVVEDSGLFIKALKGFPGTCSSYIHKRIGLKGILKLMENVSDRSCYYLSAVAYCEPGKEPVSFLGQEDGRISPAIMGDKGFGHDPIFIPEGSDKTYGEIGENFKKFRKIAAEKLKEFLR